VSLSNRYDGSLFASSFLFAAVLSFFTLLFSTLYRDHTILDLESNPNRLSESAKGLNLSGVTTAHNSTKIQKEVKIETREKKEILRLETDQKRRRTERNDLSYSLFCLTRSLRSFSRECPSCMRTSEGTHQSRDHDGRCATRCQDLKEREIRKR
jgi:branched-subunit amino acid aminotransferase/4-amino-4-deoxychorismate lyase